MALVLEEPRGQASRRTRAPIIRIIDDSFPAYDRECLIGRNGVKFRASCRASFCHRQRGNDRSIVVHPLERHWNARVARPSAIKKVFAGHYCASMPLTRCKHRFVLRRIFTSVLAKSKNISEILARLASCAKKYLIFKI